LGVTVVLLTCSYNDTEFVRVGYYVNNEYDSQEWRETPPETVQPERILRTILQDKPRVTRFPIKWDDILDETVKKPEDEEMDKDADVRGAPSAGDVCHNDGGQEGHGDEADEEDDDDDEDESETEEADEAEEEDDDDEFTSQLGPEEQDRMSMMIDEEDEDHPCMIDENMAAGNMQHSFGGPLKPSPLAAHPSTAACDDLDHAMEM